MAFDDIYPSALLDIKMKKIGCNLRVTGNCHQGQRPHMEDMFAVACPESSDSGDGDYAFCGIFDGHGGPEAARYVKNELVKTIISLKGFWSNKDEDVVAAIHDGFIATHNAMRQEVDKWPKLPNGLPSTSGTTASIAFIMNGRIYVGHVGDTCIVLGVKEHRVTRWRVEALTEDHKPENKEELSRIELAGGKVANNSGIHRVVWNKPTTVQNGPSRRSIGSVEVPFLAIARSLGDFWSYNPESGEYIVSPKPDVKVFKFDAEKHMCLIFGTDGLWNVISHTAAVMIVQNAEMYNTTRSVNSTWINPAKRLVDRAIKRWKKSELRADNTSAVVIMVDPFEESTEEEVAIEDENTISVSESSSSYINCSNSIIGNPTIISNSSLHILKHNMEVDAASSSSKISPNKTDGDVVENQNLSDVENDSTVCETLNKRRKSSESTSKRNLGEQCSKRFKTLHPRNVNLEPFCEMNASKRPILDGDNSHNDSPPTEDTAESISTPTSSQSSGEGDNLCSTTPVRSRTSRIIKPPKRWSPQHIVKNKRSSSH